MFRYCFCDNQVIIQTNFKHIVALINVMRKGSGSKSVTNLQTQNPMLSIEVGLFFNAFGVIVIGSGQLFFYDFHSNFWFFQLLSIYLHKIYHLWFGCFVTPHIFCFCPGKTFLDTNGTVEIYLHHNQAGKTAVIGL